MRSRRSDHNDFCNRVLRCLNLVLAAILFAGMTAAQAIAQSPPVPPIAAPGATPPLPPSSSASPNAVPPGPSASPGMAPPVTPQRPLADDSEFALNGLPNAESAPTAVAPYMIGDFFAGSGQIQFLSKLVNAAGRPVVVGQIPSAGGSGRAKISDDNSVMPVDRVFMLYNYFDNAILVPSPTAHTLDINRYTPGFEKTFWDRNASFELRIPFANGQNSDVYIAGNGADEDTEFGNLEAALKFLVWRDSQWAFATGIGFNMPTARNVQVFDSTSAQPTATIKNEAFHVQPYFGLLYTPGDRLFVQAFVQFDIDTNGNPVEQQNAGNVGRLYDQNLLQADLQIGFWCYKDPTAPFVTGIAPTIEYHYTTTVQGAKFVVVDTLNSRLTFGNTANRLDIQNLTLGFEFLLGQHSNLNVAAVVPLNGTDPNRQFDSEAFVEFNRFF